MKKNTPNKIHTSNDDIAVIGLSCYYPGAKTPKDFWQNILAKRQQFRDMPNCRLPLKEYWHPEKKHPDTTYGRKAAVIDGYNFDWKKRKITKTSYESTDIVQWLALDTALAALEDAGLNFQEMTDKDKTGVIVGNSLTGEFTRSENMRLRWPYVRKVLKKTAQKFDWSAEKTAEFEKEMEILYKSIFFPITEDSLAGALSNTIAGRICNFCDFHGGGYVVDGACSSSILSVITAANALSSKEMDVAIAGGVDISLDTLELVGFAKAGALTDKEMKVYDENRSGFMPGEGCGMVVLKRLEDARRDGNKVYAVLKGWGISSDGKGGITAPSSTGQSMSLIRAYERAGMTPNQLHFIEGHGTGTVLGDATELNAIKKTFDHFHEKHEKNCGMTSLKSVIGHTKAAAGIGAFIKTSIALNQRIVPPTSGVNVPNAIFGSDNFPLYPLITGKRYPQDAILNAGVSAMGFGGINSHVVLSSGDKPFAEFKTKIDEEKLSFSNQDSEIFVFSADNQDALLQKLKSSKESSLGISYAELADLAKLTSEEVSAKENFRCALVAKNPDELQRNLPEIIRYLEHNIVEEGSVFKSDKFSFCLGNKVKQPEIAFLFPGQGSQRLNSAKILTQRFSWAKSIVDELDTIAKKEVGYIISERSFFDIAKVVKEEEIKDLTTKLAESKIAQAAIVSSSIIWSNFLKKLGINPSVVGGHSLGELVALQEAGAYDVKTLFKLAVLRGYEMSNTKTTGKMISLGCDEKQAKEIISKIKDVEIANLNSPEQTIFSGTSEAIDAVYAEAKKRGLSAHPLPVSNAFHSKIMNEAAEKFGKKLNLEKEFKSESVSFLSSKLGKKVTTKLDLNSHLSSQITSPVRFIDMVKELSNLADFVIEVGSGEVLSRLVARITDGETPCQTVEKTSGSFFEVNYLLANLFVRNVEINWYALYENRLTLPFRKPSELSFIVNPLERSLEDAALEGNAFADIDQQANNQREGAVVSENNQQGAFSTVENLLVKIAAKKTGFDESSISMHHRILDDLNLDSIKSGEFVGEVTRTLGIKALDVSKFANSKLEEIAEVLKVEMANNPNGAGLEGSKQDNWVRAFAIAKSTEKLATQEQFLKGKRIVVAAFKNSDWCEALLKELNKNAKAKYFNLSSGDLKEIVGCHVIVIMPEQKLDYKNIDVKARVEMIAKLNQLSFTDLDSLNVIHFDNEVQSLFASIHHENPSLKVRVIDINAKLNLKKLVGIIGSELQNPASFISASYDEKNKYVKYPTLASDSDKNRNITWTKKDAKRDVVLVTAGAKGVTKECVLHWAKDKNISLALLGRSSEADEEVKKSLVEFAENKIKCRYYSCDVANEESVKKAVEAAQKDLGKITAVIHGAGTNSPRLFNKVRSDEAYTEISPKVLGIINVLNCVDQKNLKIIGVLSSVIGYTGMQGNAWYAWSNETIEKLLGEYQKKNPQTAICELGYSVWEEVGMGVRMGSVSTLANIGVMGISRQKGVDSFIRLMDKDLGTNNFIIVSEMGKTLDTWNHKLPAKPKANRFLENIIKFEPMVELVSEISLNLETDFYVRDHDFQGSFLFPTVFGLEAMAQNVAHLMGIESFKEPFEINDLNLDKPIVVDVKTGKKIRVRAYAESSSNVSVEITTQDSDFTEKYFYANFDLKKSPKKISVFKDSIKKLPINPQEDLYGGFLFQGPLYRKLKTINQLSTDEVICKIDPKYNPKTSKVSEFFGKNFDNELILGNPFARDVLLQTVQLCNTDRLLLPIKIQKIIIFKTGFNHAELSSKTKIISRDNDGGLVDSDVILTDGSFVTEALIGYQTKMVGNSLKANFTIADLLDPAKYDLEILSKQMKEFADSNKIELPSFGLKYIDGLIKLDKDSRHKKEEIIFKQALDNLLGQNAKKSTDSSHKITWNKDGKPQVQAAKNSKESFVSLTHDDKICLVTAGFFDQGCDVEPIRSRSSEEWKILLLNHINIWQKLAEIIDENVSGTLVWSVLESIKKSGVFGKKENYQISLNSVEKNNFLFSAANEDLEIAVAATIFEGSRPLKRVFACVARSTQEKTINSEIKLSDNLVKDIFTCKRIGSAKEEVYIHRFRTTFKEANSLDRTLHYPIFASWMGKLRELPLQPISEKLIEDMTSGLWGMVTNSSYVKIVGTAKSLDLIEGHFWVSRCYGVQNSTTDLCFKWHKVLEDGSLEVIAYSFLPTTWVKVLGHGIVEVAPFPEYFQKWIDRIVAKDTKEDYLKTITSYPERCSLGKVLFQNNIPLQSRKPNFKSDFSTSLDESNLVGNVYYAHYYSWQAKTFDQFIYNIIPNFYQFSKEQKRFICLETKVQHLREAMPFDKIEVKLYIDEIYENGLKLSYEFFCTSRGEPEKLAFGQQKVAFVKGSSDNDLCEIPEILKSYSK